MIVRIRCKDCGRWIEPLFQYCPHCGEKQGPVRHEPLYDDYFKTRTYTIGTEDVPIITWRMQ